MVRGVLPQDQSLDLVCIQDVDLSGIGDPTVFAGAAEAGRIVLTHDRDPQLKNIQGTKVASLGRKPCAPVKRYAMYPLVPKSVSWIKPRLGPVSPCYTINRFIET
ncbi:MAG: DUF5615 family PIN-like protein [Leptolyngbya sp. RL_3_1]|nr:DUF5615 family PIN-like protein [Leptolyngbya sp. RL_3_1]